MFAADEGFPPRSLARGIEVPTGRTDGGRTPASSAAMRIGYLVTYQGSTYVLRGLDPMSVTDRTAQLEDPRTGRRLVVPVEELEPAEPEAPAGGTDAPAP